MSNLAPIEVLQQQLESAEKINKLSVLNRLPEASLERLARYAEALKRWSSKIDLVSPAPLEVIIDKHIVDSVLGVRLSLSTPQLSSCRRIIDLGTGAGLPGLVGAIVESDRFFLLVEPREKRSYFLRDMLRELKIRNALVLRKRGEELSPEDIENVDLMVSRAVNRKVNLASIAEICVKDRGRLALFSAETDYEQAKSQIAAPRELEAFVPYQLPLDQAKRSVILSAK